MKMQGSRSHGGGNSGSAQSANSWSCRENLPATAELFCYCGIPAPVKKKKLLEYVAIDALGVSFSLKLAVGGIWKR
jgi:hypothetical protein